jgi:sulfite reductase (ferredoxin)
MATADYSNFPRKFKITITGCAHWCTYPEINRRSRMEVVT